MRNTQRGLSTTAATRAILRDVARLRLHREPRFWGVSILIAATSFAVGRVSLWLLAPYWTVVCWLVCDPVRIRDAARASLESQTARKDRVPGRVGALLPHLARRLAPAALARAGLAARPRPLVTAGPSCVADDRGETEPDLLVTNDRAGEGPTVPARRRRASRRPSRVSASEPPAPVMVSSWVQVGPGKYVRIEGPAPVAPAGRDSHDLESMAVVADELSPLADLIEADVLSPAAEHRDDHAAMFDVEGDSGWNVPVPEPESSELDLAGTSCACTEIPQTGENDHREACEVFPASWPETSVDAAAASEFDGDSLRELEVEETGNETGTTPEAAFEFGRAPAWGAVARERHGWDRSRAWTRMRVRRDGRWGGHAPPPRRTRVRGRRRSTRHSRAPPSSARALKARNAFEQSFRRAPRAGAAR